jgi:hypothetical protein
VYEGQRIEDSETVFNGFVLDTTQAKRGVYRFDTGEVEV